MKIKNETTIALFFVTGISFISNRTYAKVKPVTLQSALNTAYKNNLQLKSAELSVKQ